MSHRQPGLGQPRRQRRRSAPWMAEKQVIDLDKVEANIAKLQGQCEAAGVANRPHVKTHKSPELAKMQVDAGASGITCLENTNRRASS